MSGERRRLNAGRVLAVKDGELTLQRAGGEIETVRVSDPSGSFAAGDLVRGGNGGSFEVIFRHPSGDWPAPKSDGLRFLDGSLWTRLSRRADLLEHTRRYFREAGFLEVETPLVVQSVGTEVHIDPTRALQRPSSDGPTEERFLVPSPEHHMKRLLAAGSPPLFSIGPVWRDGERGERHRPEFTLLEWYRPWESLEAIFEDCERWLRDLHGAPTLTYQGTSLDWRGPWPRLPFLKLLETRANIVEPERLSPEEQLFAFVDRVEPTMGQERPEFVVDYPVAFASLARRQPGRPQFAERFELYAGGLELANAFGELTDEPEQRARCEADNEERARSGKETLPLDEAFLAALSAGMPPSAGIAVGIDRVVMLLCDARTIDEVRAF